ncbi:hypothetical protein [Halorubrum ezzemoulense]|uniref:hypothetical protein n=1 Tax=Halorubrum ezzemoulense TaxID=337243 RepID=UPI00232E6251|nr:hypothetical protein [Halorubrum ezzemoulense]MDB2237144.1 hypothetical protein [Halorubrum ezzemoulense]MDB2246906.1 hypothetical protein [Halorubrum ezzemoulense]
MSTDRRTTLLSHVHLPSGWLPVAVACGSAAALLGLALTWIGLAVAGVSPGESEVARWMVGGPISAVEGSIWFLLDAHWVRVRTGPGLSNHVIFGHPLIQADAALWPLRAVPLTFALGAAAAVRYLGIDDLLAGAVTGMGATLGYLPTMLALRAVSRVPLTRHATDGTVPISDADGIPVTEAAGVTAGPDFAATVLLVTGLGVVVGHLVGASATFATGD